MTNDDVAKDGIAFAIAYADNCKIPDGYASEKAYDNQDWMSDWAAYLADAVWAELQARGFRIVRLLPPMGLQKAFDNCDKIHDEFERRKECGLPYPTLAEIDDLLRPASAVSNGGAR